jgi:hypothetical protein
MATDRATAGERSRSIEAVPEQLVLPRLMTLARQAAPGLLMGIVAPVAMSHAALTVIGLNGALTAAVAWGYGGAGRRLLRRPLVRQLILECIHLPLPVTR